MKLYQKIIKYLHWGKGHLSKKTFKYFAYGRKYNINMNINRIYGGSILTTSFSCASMSQVN